MEEVYGFEMTDGAGDFFGYTADHLFADIWNRPGPLRPRPPAAADRAARRHAARHDVLTIQIPAALRATASSTTSALREIVIFLCHYAGWPVGARLNNVVEKILSTS